MFKLPVKPRAIENALFNVRLNPWEELEGQSGSMDFTGLLVLAMGFASYPHAHRYLGLILEYIHIVSAGALVLIRILS